MSEAAWIVVETACGDWHIMPVSDVMPHVADLSDGRDRGVDRGVTPGMAVPGA